MLGNVEDHDVEGTVRAVPSMLAREGAVLLTRHPEAR